MFLRRLVGVLFAGSIFAIGYVLIKGPSDIYQIGGNDGFYLSGWRVILGSVGLLVGLPLFMSFFGVGDVPRNWRLGVVGSAVLAGVLALVLTASFEPPPAAAVECTSLADFLQDEDPTSEDIELTFRLGLASNDPEIKEAAASARAALEVDDELQFEMSIREWARACSE